MKLDKWLGLQLLLSIAALSYFFMWSSIRTQWMQQMNLLGKYYDYSFFSFLWDLSFFIMLAIVIILIEDQKNG